MHVRNSVPPTHLVYLKPRNTVYNCLDTVSVERRRRCAQATGCCATWAPDCRAVGGDTADTRRVSNSAGAYSAQRGAWPGVRFHRPCQDHGGPSSCALVSGWVIGITDNSDTTYNTQRWLFKTALAAPHGRKFIVMASDQLRILHKWN